MKKRNPVITKIDESKYEIELAGGHKTIVDAEDAWIFDVLPCWHAASVNGKSKGKYATYRCKQKPYQRPLYLHRIVLAAKLNLIESHDFKGIIDAVRRLSGIADHINRDTLNNTRANIRSASRAQNIVNSPKYKGKSKYKGVSPRQSEKWVCYVADKYIGTYNDELTAAKQYNKFAYQRWGEFACLNDIPEQVDLPLAAEFHGISTLPLAG